VKALPLAFSVSPRVATTDDGWGAAFDVAELSERFGFNGMLIFTGNDVILDPWLVAQGVLERTQSLSPLIAVNPVYMHPFTAAKMISSLVRLYGRKLHINMVTGTALNYQHALGDQCSHDDRYTRLGEYIAIMKSLLSNQKPITQKGKYYSVDQLQLFPGIESRFQPEFMLSGQSDAARQVCRGTGSVGTQMLPADLEQGIVDVPGIHFGIITRPTEEEAWRVAKALFPTNEEDQAVLDYSMLNTDSTWKISLKRQADTPTSTAKGYWLEPFANMKADCPYLVGSYDFVSDRVDKLMQRGISHFIFDIPPIEEEFFHVSAMMRIQSSK